MTQDRWTAVDTYISKHMVGDDDVLDAALADAAHAGLPAHDVAPNQGTLLALLARNPEYLEWSLRLTAPGSVIVADQTVGSKGYDGFAIALVEGDAEREEDPTRG